MTEIELLTPDKIIRSKRKSISLNIENNGDFIVRAPIYSTEKQIFQFIIEKSHWIITKRLKAKQNSKSHILKLENNQTINLFGKEYIIILYNKSNVKIIENVLYLPTKNTKEKLISFLKKFAKLTIEERTNILAKQFDFEFNKISISSAKTNWGSCSHNNNLHFTFRLCFCPMLVVDYIIIHELSHTKIKNHSKKFWLLVEKFCPEFKQHNKWLKDNRHIMEII